MERVARGLLFQQLHHLVVMIEHFMSLLCIHTPTPYTHKEAESDKWC